MDILHLSESSLFGRPWMLHPLAESRKQLGVVARPQVSQPFASHSRSLRHKRMTADFLQNLLIITQNIRDKAVKYSLYLLLNWPKLLVLVCSQFNAFPHVLRMHFSIRTVGLLNTCARVGRNIAIFDFNYRDISTQLSRCFFALFRTIRKTHPNTIEYQRVATVIFVRKFLPKITAFSALSHLLHPSWNWNFRRKMPM